MANEVVVAGWVGFLPPRLFIPKRRPKMDSQKTHFFPFFSLSLFYFFLFEISNGWNFTKARNVESEKYQQLGLRESSSSSTTTTTTTKMMMNIWHQMAAIKSNWELTWNKKKPSTASTSYSERNARMIRLIERDADPERRIMGKSGNNAEIISWNGMEFELDRKECRNELELKRDQMKLEVGGERVRAGRRAKDGKRKWKRAW